MNELISKWQHVLDRVNIRTWTEVLTLAFLADLASRCDLMIECGSYTGASAKTMLLANPKLHLTCIDTFECRNEPMMSDYPKDMTTGDICEQITLKREIDDGRCQLIVGNSQVGFHKLVNSAPDLESSRFYRFDGIFIDDGHSTPEVLADIKFLMPFLKPGGTMIGHDFDSIPDYNDVARGVIQSGLSYDLPIPRLWRHIKPM
jgi:predicted O-methyltransferase YrrM